MSIRHKAIHSIDLQITPGDAWDRLKDLSLAPQYVPGVKSMEFITRKTTGIGAERIVFPQKLKERVIGWEPEREVVLALSKNGRERFFPFKKARFRYVISETGGTYMTLSLEYFPMMGRLGYFLFGGAVSKRIRKTAQNLKLFYES